MAGNTFGSLFRISSFGESHGPAIGVVIDGCPAGLELDLSFIQNELDRRRPGQSVITTQRREADRIRILSGVFEGRSLGSPIAMLIDNTDSRPEDYEAMRHTYRPSHADYTWQQKYGLRDYRGGGRASARETATRVAAGAVAKLLLATEGISIRAYVSAVGPVRLADGYAALDLSKAERNIVRCPDEKTAAEMIALIETCRAEGDSIGGQVSCVVQHCRAGLGEPVFDKLHADLGKAMLSINAVKGFEYGSGFEGTTMKGSQHNDLFVRDSGRNVITGSNHSGGIQGGISNGMDIYFRVAFKPVATILQAQQTIDDAGNEIALAAKGRHDPCVVPRAVPVVEAMAALVLADHLLRSKTAKI